MSASDKLIKKILKDIQIEATDEFDRNFERKGFFVSSEWQQIKGSNNKGTLMMRSGKLRRSIRSEVRGNEVIFTSTQIYAKNHNEGGLITVKSHARKSKKGKDYTVKAFSYNLPKRQFIGEHLELDKNLTAIIEENLSNFFNQHLTDILKP